MITISTDDKLAPEYSIDVSGWGYEGPVRSTLKTANFGFYKKGTSSAVSVGLRNTEGTPFRIRDVKWEKVPVKAHYSDSALDVHELTATIDLMEINSSEKGQVDGTLVIEYITDDGQDGRVPIKTTAFLQ